MEPYQIEHLVEIIVSEGQVDQFYNYLVYRFEGHGAYVWARTYLDEIHTVSVFGPFKSADELVPIGSPNLMNGVVEYLKTRFSNLQVLSENGNVKVP
ncbi:MAG: hypothetical protein AAFR75_01265 [Pseudomonadota bacterium]